MGWNTNQLLFLLLKSDIPAVPQALRSLCLGLLPWLPLGLEFGQGAQPGWNHWTTEAMGCLASGNDEHSELERSTIFYGKIHYFDWAIFDSYVKLQEGIDCPWTDHQSSMISRHWNGMVDENVGCLLMINMRLQNKIGWFSGFRILWWWVNPKALQDAAVDGIYSNFYILGMWSMYYCITTNHAASPKIIQTKTIRNLVCSLSVKMEHTPLHFIIHHLPEVKIHQLLTFLSVQVGWTAMPGSSPPGLFPWPGLRNHERCQRPRCLVDFPQSRYGCLWVVDHFKIHGFIMVNQSFSLLKWPWRPFYGYTVVYHILRPDRLELTWDMSIMSCPLGYPASQVEGLDDATLDYYVTRRDGTACGISQNLGRFGDPKHPKSDTFQRLRKDNEPILSHLPVEWTKARSIQV